MKLLIISGPTATGKTALAVKLAQKFNGELISADSRQIYKGLDIGVGKDHPKNIKLHLIDLINPNQRFSVAEYQKLALKTIKNIHSRGKLPIVVGCSGFYIDSIINPNYSTFSTQPNRLLRFVLNFLPLSILQLILKSLDFRLFSSLNFSDSKNPRRLIRKIEIKLFSNKTKVRNLKLEAFDFLHISLTAPNSFLYSRIDARVDQRLKLGHLQELNTILKNYSWSDPGLQISAYKVYHHQPNPIQSWKYAEHRDARRQKTWFKKLPHVTYIDISMPKNYLQVSKIVHRWLINDKIHHGSKKN